VVWCRCRRGSPDCLDIRNGQHALWEQMSASWPEALVEIVEIAVAVAVAAGDGVVPELVVLSAGVGAEDEG